jgi:hypothetical protein
MRLNYSAEAMPFINILRLWRFIIKIHQSTIKCAGSLGRWDKQLIDQASDVPIIIIFFIKSCKVLCKNPFNLCSYKITKMKIKSFECPKSMKNNGTSDTWSASPLSHRPSEPVYHIVDCRINTSFVRIFYPHSFHPRLNIGSNYRTFTEKSTNQYDLL